ncbi:MAG: FAD-dependent oxidoreductase [Dehalococcoidia bacterium]|nr:FAD-dependent oxidoreductase [Dehalococcoidia bacterium]
MTQYGFFIDLSRCIGCHGCVIACKQWHDIQPGPTKWMRVYQWEKGAFPNIDLRMLTIPCFHCEKPVCAEACPNKAIIKEEKYGAVLVDPEKCTGERKCFEACPYGAPQFENDAPGTKMTKCTMCFDRMEKGDKPICVLSCSMRALEFGPLDEIRKKYNPRGLESAGAPACSVSCPAGIDAGGYIKLIAEGKAKEGLEVFRQAAPFAGVLGRVCAHPCEVDCLRGQFDDAISICTLKRYMADSEFKTGRVKAVPVKRTRQDRIAIIGSGPAGLACAYDLVRQGYPVTIFEAAPQTGGLMRYGIPEYRLPKSVLEDEISYVQELGAELKTNSRVEKLEDLFSQGYKAAFIATGAWQSLKMGIPGEEASGVLYAIDFLKQANSGRKVKLGKRVAVIGGGSVAIDAARVAKRLGAEEVHLICLECRDFTSKDRMLAQPEEVTEAEKDGVIVHPCLGLKRILTSKNNRVLGLETMACVSVRERDGKFAPKYKEDELSTLKVGNVIMAIGQMVDKSTVPGGLEHTALGTVAVDPVTLATSMKGVFAGGDVAGGGADVISAIAAGKGAAVSIDRYLSGKDLKAGRRPVIASRSLKPPLRKKAYAPLGEWDEKTAIEQANRCLNCGITIPSVVFRPVDPKREIVPWDAQKALELWQKRHPDSGEALPDIFTDISEVTRDASDIMGRKELKLKPRSTEEMMFCTTDDE